MLDDANLPHVDGSVNPVRISKQLTLVQIKDLESEEKKIAKLEKFGEGGRQGCQTWAGGTE